VQQILNGTWATTKSMTYDSHGRITSTADAKGNTTNILGFGTDPNTGSTTPFPALVQRPLMPVEHYTYDDDTGNLLSYTDPNSTVTTIQRDEMGRPTLESETNGQTSLQTMYCYSDGWDATCPLHQPLPYGEYARGFSGASVEKKYDGLGRLTDSIVNSATTHTTYDSLGRVSSVSNPYLSLMDSTYGITSYSYDALGRKILQTQPDGNTVHWCYDGIGLDGQADCPGNLSSVAGTSWVLVTDERGGLSEQVSDALGNLKAVMSQDPSGINLDIETDYGYDTLGNLTGVTQRGLSGEVSRTRSFQYDAMSRLLWSQNPETGLICYGQGDGTIAGCQGNGYDPNGNIVYKTDANQVLTHYTYDNLNRLTSKSSSDGSVADSYQYDQASVSSYPAGRLTTMTRTGGTNTTYSYDPVGRVVGATIAQPDPGATVGTITIGYTDPDFPTSIIYPDGRVVIQTNDGYDRLGTVTSGGISYIAGGSYGNIGYLPGTNIIQNFTLGNGVSQTNFFNHRVQLCRTEVNSPIQATNTNGGNLLDREKFYSAGGTNCSNETNNNGNIWSIVDNLQVANSQSFGYDNLNRLSSALQSGGGYNHTYNYDSFGNMVLQDNLHTNPDFSIDSARNQLLRNAVANVTDSYGHPLNDFTYDYAGNMVSSGQAPIGHTLTYNALSQVTAVDGGAATYGYDGADERTFKSTSSGWTDYFYVNGQMLAELNSVGTWTDYVYANGQKIAKADSQKPLFHMHGVRDGNTPDMVCGVIPPISGLSGSISGVTVLPGDKMVYDIRQTSTGSALASAFVIFFQNGQAVGGIPDSEGNTPSMYSVSNTGWNHSVSDMSGFAGQVMTDVWAGIQGEPWTGYGTWDVWIANAAVLRADGSVLPLFTGQSASVAGIGSTCGGNQQTFQTELTPVSDPNINTDYYLADHLGTTQMELNAGGWPVWEGQFTPFGQELDTQITTNQFKFTGKERDTESGLDYFGARHYSSSMGRFMSPDPSGLLYANPANPQSLNLYSYVQNNPLANIDPNGLDCVFLSDDSKSIEEIDADSDTSESDCNTSGGTHVIGHLTGYASSNNDGVIDEYYSNAYEVKNGNPGGMPNPSTLSGMSDYLSTFLSGTGPTNVFYGQDNTATQQMAATPNVRTLRYQYMNAGCPGTPDAPAALAQGHIDAYKDSMQSTPFNNPTQFEVGGYSGSISTTNGVTTFTINNPSSLSSLNGESAAFGSHHSDNPMGPTGPAHTVNQTFQWSEAGLCGGS